MRIYGPAIVLAIWAVVWGAGYTSDGVVLVGLLATALAVAVHCIEMFGGGHHGS